MAGSLFSRATRRAQHGRGSVGSSPDLVSDVSKKNTNAPVTVIVDANTGTLETVLKD
jgi:hypothetical protein